jgi:pyridoxal/pyridoxine/pyridoxamine kinase
MNTAEQELREFYDGLKPGDRVEVIHGVTVGYLEYNNSWKSIASRAASPRTSFSTKC